MTKAYIKAISSYLPERILTNDDLQAEFPDWTAEKVSKKVGISERRISAPDEFASDLACKAAERLFQEHGIDRNKIDFVLLCTQSPDFILPTTACIVQTRLGLSMNAGALDFNLGCSGYVYGLSLAKGLIFGRIASNVLLLTAETYTKLIHRSDRGNRSLFSDGATATLVSTEGFAEIGSFVLGTDGSGAQNLIVKNGGSRSSRTVEVQKDVQSTVEDPDNYLYMNGPEVFSFTLEKVPILVDQTLEKNNLKREDISLFVFHQANQHMLNFLRKKAEIDEARFFGYLDKVGNTVSSTIPLALEEAQRQRRLIGSVLLAGFGVGYSWGGVVVNVTD